MAGCFFIVMAKEYAQHFYNSRAWKNCQRAYKKSVGGLCERCKKEGIIKAGVMVHHKEHITPENINDPTITLDWSNLELLCRECHALEHEADIYNASWLAHVKKEKLKRTQRFEIDSDGNLLIIDPPSLEKGGC